jgi:hypothetical protein
MASVKKWRETNLFAEQNLKTLRATEEEFALYFV